MFQEYFALSLFVGAVIIALFSLFRFFYSEIHNRKNKGCNGYCHCKSSKATMRPNHYRIRGQGFRQHHLK